MLEAWLAFSVLLRPGEVDSLRVGDLLFPVDDEVAQGSALLISIKNPKTKRYGIINLHWRRRKTLFGGSPGGALSKAGAADY